MSNHLAVATVTGTLRTVITDAVAAVPGAAVTMQRPDGAAANQGAGINIFLYQVTPNAAYRNADLPTRRSDGELLQRPQAALVLHYLLSFFGDDGKLEPQRLLGAAPASFMPGRCCARRRSRTRCSRAIQQLPEDRISQRSWTGALHAAQSVAR